MRTMTPAQLVQLLAQSNTPVLLFEGEFASGTVRLWTGIGDLDWNGDIWTGLGSILTVQTVPETQQIVSQAVVLTLSGVPPENVSLVLSEVNHGQFGRLWLGFLAPVQTEGPGALGDGALGDAGLGAGAISAGDAPGVAPALVADPTPVFGGEIDAPAIVETAAGPTIQVSYQDRMVDLDRPRLHYYTSSDQQAFYQTDQGFSFVPNIQEWDGVWG